MFNMGRVIWFFYIVFKMCYVYRSGTLIRKPIKIYMSVDIKVLHGKR